MDSLTRQERQQLRQRGAGMRNIENGNFDLNFYFDSNREERQLSRQRGAANRTADTVDFGLSFPTNEPSPLRRPATPAKSLTNPDTISPDKSQSHTEDTRGSKRRRTSQRQQSGQFFIIAEDEPVESSGHENGMGAYTSQTVQDSMAQSHQENNEGNFEKSHLQSQAGGPSSGKNARPLREHSTPNGSRHGSIKESDSMQNTTRKLQNGLNTVILDTNTNPTPKIMAAKKRKKRKSIVLVKRRKRSSVQDTIRSTDDTSGSKGNAVDAPAREDNERSIFDLHITPDPPLSPINRDEEGQGSTENATADDLNDQSHIGAVMANDTNIDSDQSFVFSQSSPAVPPASTSSGRQRTVKKKAAARKGPSPRFPTSSIPPDPRSGFPVLTYRMCNTQHLPIINEVDEHGPDLEDQAIGRRKNTSFAATRPHPNALDVLSQICRETIKGFTHRISNSTMGKSGSFLNRRKRSAVDAFEVHIDQRCFAMSESVENRSCLEARLRKIKREKAEMQSKWMEIRNEREQIALRCDQIRQQHWENEGHAHLQWQLSQAVQTLEGQLERRDAGHEQSLEWLLRSVSHQVGNIGQASVLQRVQSFNVQLEAALKAFESRR